MFDSSIIGSKLWVERDEFFAYFQDVARNKLNLVPHTTFNAKVLSATCVNNQWTLEVQDVKTGAITRHTHSFVMCSVGQLNIPWIPEPLEKTRDKFEGFQFHSARWPANADLKGKRVACIGTGSSAIQFCPRVAEEAKELIVFQRSPGYMVEKHNYRYPEFVKMIFRYVPFARLALRYYHLVYAEIFLYHLIIKDSGQKPTKSNLFFTKALQDEMKQHLPESQHDKLIPKETLGCKRFLLSSEWLEMFKKDHVKLVVDPVTEITATGLKTASGQEFKDIDVIIYGTGFETGSFFKNLPVSVVDDKTQTTYELHKDIWKNIPRAYRGVTFDKVPNFACTYGPNTNVNHSTIISLMEAEVNHFGELVSKVIAEKKNKFVVTTEAYERFNKEEQAELDKTAFSADCNSWYRRNDGNRILNNWHGSLIGFWMTVSRPDFNDYQVA